MKDIHFVKKSGVVYLVINNGELVVTKLKVLRRQGIKYIRSEGSKDIEWTPELFAKIAVALDKVYKERITEDELKEISQKILEIDSYNS